MREPTFTNAICKAESKQISKDFAYCEDALGRAENAIGNLSSAEPEIKECPMCPDCPDNCPLEVEHERR